jgi:signal transduction histidine kinase
MRVTSLREFLARHGLPRPLGRSRDAHSVRLLAVLGLALLATIALAAQGIWASRDQRRAAEGALRDYARFAASNYAMDTQRAFRQSALAIFSWLGATSGRLEADRLYELRVLQEAAADVKRCECMWDPKPRYFFRYLPATDSLSTAGSMPPAPPELARLRDSLRVNPDSMLFDPQHLLRGAFFLSTMRDSAGEEIVVLTALRGVHGAPDAVYGFVTRLSTFAPYTFRAIWRMTMLPPSIMHGASNDSLMSVKVWDGDHLVFQSRPEPDTVYAASVPLWSTGQSSATRIQVAIIPGTAQRLLIGGMDEPRMPLVIVLFALTCTLLLSAFFLARREQELAEIREDFTSSISHELRTPLAEIMVYAEMLQLGRATAPAERTHALSVIVREARHLTHLINNVLFFSRAGRDKPTVPPAPPIPLAPLVREIVRGFAPLARQHGTSIREDLDEDLAASMSATALQHALLNLLDNAVKFAPSGSVITVGSALHDGMARLWVDDQGTGVPAAERERIWKPYIRLARDVGTSTGSGIGLAVVRLLVERYDGRAWVDEAPNGGARFTIEMPGGRLPSAAPSDGSPHASATPIAVSCL